MEGMLRVVVNVVRTAALLAASVGAAGHPTAGSPSMLMLVKRRAFPCGIGRLLVLVLLAWAVCGLPLARPVLAATGIEVRGAADQSAPEFWVVEDATYRALIEAGRRGQREEAHRRQ